MSGERPRASGPGESEVQIGRGGSRTFKMGRVTLGEGDTEAQEKWSTFLSPRLDFFFLCLAE